MFRISYGSDVSEDTGYGSVYDYGSPKSEDDRQSPFDMADVGRRMPETIVEEPHQISQKEPEILSIPGMPDMDLSQFSEEERHHLLSMFSKATELESEVHSQQSSRRSSFGSEKPHGKPQSTYSSNEQLYQAQGQQYDSSEVSSMMMEDDEEEAKRIK